MLIELFFLLMSTEIKIYILSSVKYTPQWSWLRDELKRVDREKTPWLIVLMHAPLYNSNGAHYMEGESMRAAFESWFVSFKVDMIFAGHVHAYERSVCFVLFNFLSMFFSISYILWLHFLLNIEM